MAIQYALVARGSVVLAEFGGAGTNAGGIARQILEKIPGTSDSHVSYSQDRHIFHVKRTDGITVLCMADDSAGRRIPFAFLEDIHGRFVKTYGRACHTALAYAMNEEFSRVLNQQMDYYSNDPNADRMNRIKGEMSQVRNVMIENIDKVLERGDRLEILVDRTANMQGNTIRFRKQARRFRNTVWWRNVKLTFPAISFEFTSVNVRYILEKASVVSVETSEVANSEAVVRMTYCLEYPLRKMLLMPVEPFEANKSCYVCSEVEEVELLAGNQFVMDVQEALLLRAALACSAPANACCCSVSLL